MQTRGGNIENQISNHLTVAFNTCNLEFFCKVWREKNLTID